MDAMDRTVLMRAIGSGVSAAEIERVLQSGLYARFIDQTDPSLGVTPLMLACSARPDDDETVKVAELLIKYGAKVDTRDTSGPGCTPLMMASQEGKPTALRLLIKRGARIDITPNNSNTQAISFAAQHGNAAVVSVLAEAAVAQGKSILEARSEKGRTPAYIGVERAFPEVVGVLAKAGGDLRKACPVYFCVQEDALVDPLPDFPKHYALNAAVRSFLSRSCNHCGNDSPRLKCSRCRMTMYCSRECQKKNWSSHKHCCTGLRRGQDMYGNVEDGIPGPPSEIFGFQEPFCDADQVYDGYDDYDPETHAVWEYDAGGPGHPNWCRYPVRIETRLESMAVYSGSPRLMYRPGNPEADGSYEREMSIVPPSDVATRYVYFCDMVEREIYTGAARSVRRNGKRSEPKEGGFW